MRAASGVTIRDVAGRAGVSIQTVSRVLNGRVDVAATTRDRVARAVAELGFVPSAAARALAGTIRPTVGVLTYARFASSPYFAGVIEGAALETSARGCAPLIAPVDGSEAGVTATVEMLLAHRVAGVVVAAPHDAYTPPFRRALGRIPVPVVSTGAFRDPLGIIPTIDADNWLGSRLAAAHLLDLGHRRIAVITGPTTHAGALDRLAGVADALGCAGIAWDDRRVLAAQWDYQAGLDAMVALLDRDSTCTAVICHHDQAAIGAIAALVQTGRRVPDDVSVVGFGDLRVGAFLRPALTTVRRPAREIGAAAVRRVLGADAAAPPLVTLPAELVVRETSAVPRLAAAPPLDDALAQLIVEGVSVR